MFKQLPQPKSSWEKSDRCKTALFGKVGEYVGGFRVACPVGGFTKEVVLGTKGSLVERAFHSVLPAGFACYFIVGGGDEGSSAERR